ncbi:MAG: hypothetical protein ACTSUE_11250 [Promethearchaeota archaeon]
MKRKRRKEDIEKDYYLRKRRKRKRCTIPSLLDGKLKDSPIYARKRKRDAMEECSLDPLTPERRKLKRMRFGASTKLLNCPKTQLLEYRRRMEYRFNQQKRSTVLRQQVHSYRRANSVLFMACCAREDKRNWMVDE